MLLLVDLASAGFADYLPGAGAGAAAGAGGKASSAASSVPGQVTAGANAASQAAADAATAAANANAHAQASIGVAGAQVRVGIYDHLSTFWQRHQPSEFYMELALLALLAAYALAFAAGNGASEGVAKLTFGQLYRRLREEFAVLGLHADTAIGQSSSADSQGIAQGQVQGRAPLSKDGNDRFLSYATGRRGIDGLHISITTLPRHDLLLGYAFKLGYGMLFDTRSMADRLELTLQLPAASLEQGFVWAVVNKEVMRKQRLFDWDLGFTKTLDLPNVLPREFVCMAEIAECTEKLLPSNTPNATAGAGAGATPAGIAELVRAAGDALEYLIISDLPSEQPGVREDDKADDLARAQAAAGRVLRLSVLIGRANRRSERLLDTVLAAALDLADNTLPKIKLSPNAKAKLQATRLDCYRTLVKNRNDPSSTPGGRGSASAGLSSWFNSATGGGGATERLTRKEQRDKDQKDRLGKLSATEQKKSLQKERERLLKKQQSKQSKRG